MNFKIVFFLFLSFVGISNGAIFLTFGGKGFTTQNRIWTLNVTEYTRTSPIDTKVSNKAAIEYLFRSEDSLTLPWWTISMASPANQVLDVGTFTNTVHDYFTDEIFPSFILGGDGRVDSRMTGTFTILEIEWSPLGSYATKVAADFNLSDTLGENTVFGSLRYNSDIPVGAVPEPSSVTLLGLLGPGLVARRKR